MGGSQGWGPRHETARVHARVHRGEAALPRPARAQLLEHYPAELTNDSSPAWPQVGPHPYTTTALGAVISHGCAKGPSLEWPDTPKLCCLLYSIGYSFIAHYPFGRRAIRCCIIYCTAGRDRVAQFGTAISTLVKLISNV